MTGERPTTMTPDERPVAPAAAGEADRSPEPAAPLQERRPRARTSLFAVGEPMIWLTGGALIVCLIMVIGLLFMICCYGLSTFWPHDVVRVTTADGGVYMGEITRTESFDPAQARLDGLAPELLIRVQDEIDASENRTASRRLFRTGNFRITQNHFQWIDDFLVEKEDHPEWALVIERLEWGRFYGFPDAFVHVASFIEPEAAGGEFKSLDLKRDEARDLVESLSPRHGGAFRILAEVFVDGEMRRELLPLEECANASDSGAVADIVGVAEVVEGAEAAWGEYEEFHDLVRTQWRDRRDLEKYDTGEINQVQEEARLEKRSAELDLADAESEYGTESSEYADALADHEATCDDYEKVVTRAGGEFAAIRRQIDSINEMNGRFLLRMQTAGEGSTPPRNVLMRLDEIVRAYPANRLSLGDKIGVYCARWWEYLTEEPREANSEGGIFPAIFGTVIMTLMMALAVVPFGVLAALYLKEYAKSGPIVSAVRIAVNNLAGVPSIVFGVFGLGFFCYGVGSFIDGGPSWAMPKPTWFVVLATVSVVGAGAFFTFLRSMVKPGKQATRSQRVLRALSLVLWGGCALTVIVLVATTPFFSGFYRASLPNPTFGKGALIWASFTLALLTLPVVIVATEEALSAVPNSMREGSYACGASKWQTIRRIVLPRALPGIMTGMILAMARGAGEVAPLMLVGAVKLAPELPLDLAPPFGLNRSFMHLGFHIYDVGFQSQNSEAAKPMVFTTTLLLIFIVAALNVFAIWLRSRLRRRFVETQF